MKYLGIGILLTLLAGCSGHLEEPAFSFGKKCAVTDKGQVNYSYIWIYNKADGLKADKETCEIIE